MVFDPVALVAVAAAVVAVAVAGVVCVFGEEDKAVVQCRSVRHAGI